jgi:hypothetical protein
MLDDDGDYVMEPNVRAVIMNSTFIHERNTSDQTQDLATQTN